VKKRIMAIVLIAGLSALCACGASGSDKTLREHGLDVIGQMDEMVGSDAYLDMYTGDGEIRETLRAAAEGKHTELLAVYSVAMPENAAEMWAFAETDFGELSESLQKRVLSQAYGSALISQVNARGGAVTLAAASVCTGSKTFVCPKAEGSALYIYTFRDACPVAVSFAEGEDDAFFASGMFLLDENFDASSQESISSAFAELGAVVSLVE